MTGTAITLFLATQTVQPIFPLYIVERGASTFELGLIISLLSFTAIIAKVPLAILAERVGKWPIIPAALLGQSLCLLLYSMISIPLWFYPVRVFHALIFAAFTPTAIAIASDLAPPGKRGDRIGRFLTSFGATTMFGPFLCTLLLEYLDYPQLFQFAATIPIFGLAAFLLARRGSPSAFFSSGRGPRRKEDISLLSSLKGIAFSRNMLVLSYLRLTFSFTNAFLITLFAVYASDSLLLSSSLIALLFGVKGVTNMVFRFPSGKLSDKIGHKGPLLLAYLLLTLAYLAISGTGNFHVLALAMTVYGLAHGVRAVTEWSLLGETTPSKTSGVATAYLSTMFNIGGALGAVAAGALSLILSTQTIFRLASLIILSGVFTTILVRTGPQGQD